jgi:hypothetical protein
VNEKKRDRIDLKERRKRENFLPPRMLKEQQRINEKRQKTGKSQ